MKKSLVRTLKPKVPVISILFQTKQKGCLVSIDAWSAILVREVTTAGILPKGKAFRQLIKLAKIGVGRV